MGAGVEAQGPLAETVHGYSSVYSRCIRPTLGRTEVAKVKMKMLTDLYGAHQDRGLSPRSVYQIHACLSSMFTQACRWGWLNPTRYSGAEPPALSNVTPVVATPAEIKALLDAAEESRRPEYARAILVAATTGLRRAEPCAPRWPRALDFDAMQMTVSASVVSWPQPVGAARFYSGMVAETDRALAGRRGYRSCQGALFPPLARGCDRAGSPLRR